MLELDGVEARLPTCKVVIHKQLTVEPLLRLPSAKWLLPEQRNLHSELTVTEKSSVKARRVSCLWGVGFESVQQTASARRSLSKFYVRQPFNPTLLAPCTG